MSSSPAKAVSGLLRCKGTSQSSGEQCRHTQYDSQYCWMHKDQADPPSENHAAELNRLELIHATILAGTNRLLSCRPRYLLVFGFLASLWLAASKPQLVGSKPQLVFSVPEYRGPVRVCAIPEPSLDIFNQHHPYTDRSKFLRRLNPFKQMQINPVFEPASLVDHIINVTLPAAAAGAQNLTDSQTRGLAIWQNCSKEKVSSNFDLQCPFDAFNQLFFGSHLAGLKVGWMEPTSRPATLAEKFQVPKHVTLGYTTYFVPQSRQRLVNSTILSGESRVWHSLSPPNVHGVLLHEMAHAYFGLYACSDARDWDGQLSNTSNLYSRLSNLGYSGHGPEWLRLTRALEKAASEYLGLGKLDLKWRLSVHEEIAIVKSRREGLVGIRHFNIEVFDKYFGNVIPDMDKFLRSTA